MSSLYLARSMRAEIQIERETIGALSWSRNIIWVIDEGVSSWDGRKIIEIKEILNRAEIEMGQEVVVITFKIKGRVMMDVEIFNIFGLIEVRVCLIHVIVLWRLE